VFWPVPNVDSGLVSVTRTAPPAGVTRDEVFSLIDAAFAQRRKQLKSALSGWLPGHGSVQEVLDAAGVDPRARGEELSLEDFCAITRAATSAG